MVTIRTELHVDSQLALASVTYAILTPYLQDVRLITNTSEKKRIVEACHSDPTSGHLGVKRTITRIRERFSWKGLNKEAAVYVRSRLCTTDHASVHAVHFESFLAGVKM